MIFWFSTETFSSAHTGGLLQGILRFFHCDLSPASFDNLHLYVRKLAHLTEYAVFALLLHRWLRSTRRFRKALGAACLTLALAGLYSLTDEFHQSFTSTRTASLRDCAIDTLGAAAGLAGYFMVKALQKRSALS